MSEEKELKLACLHQAGGDLDHAQRLFDWVSGSVRATPDSEAAEVSAPKQDKPQQPFNYQHPSKYGTDVPRRCYLEELTPEERAIRDLVDTVERLGAHPLLTATVIQLMKAGEDLADWVDIGLRDKAIAALSPGNDLGLLDDGQQETAPVQSAIDQDKATQQIINIDPALFPKPPEGFVVPPMPPLEDYEIFALENATGNGGDPDQSPFPVAPAPQIIEAATAPLNLSSIIDVDDIVDRSLDGMLGELAGHDNDPTDLIDHIKKDQWDALQARLRAVTDEWQTEQNIVVAPNMFTHTTNPERLTYLYVDAKHVPARKWEEAPFEGVMDAKHVADGDTYALINGEWFGPLPEGAHAPIEAAETTADAERILVVTDQDRVEQADLLLENQPGVSSQASSGEANDVEVDEELAAEAENLTSFELEYLHAFCGLIEAKPWGAAMSAVMETLAGHRMIVGESDATPTKLGRAVGEWSFHNLYVGETVSGFDSAETAQASTEQTGIFQSQTEAALTDKDEPDPAPYAPINAEEPAGDAAVFARGMMEEADKPKIDNTNPFNPFRLFRQKEPA